MVTKKGYRDLVTRKEADAQRKTTISRRNEIAGVGVKILCGWEGDVYKSKEKETHRKRANICIYCVEKQPVWWISDLAILPLGGHFFCFHDDKTITNICNILILLKRVLVLHSVRVGYLSLDAFKSFLAVREYFLFIKWCIDYYFYSPNGFIFLKEHWKLRKIEDILKMAQSSPIQT